MSSYNPRASGIGNSAAYQVSGIPYATASITVTALGHANGPMPVEFSHVTKFVTIVNTNTGANVPLRFGFSSLGVTGSALTSGGAPAVPGGSDHYFLLDNGESYTGEFRVSKLFLLSDTDGTTTKASIVAGLTSVPATDLPHNWSGSAGVG